MRGLSDDCSDSPARISSQLTPNEFSAETIRSAMQGTRNRASCHMDSLQQFRVITFLINVILQFHAHE